MKYGLSKSTNLSYDEAIEKVTSELKKEGFGVLTTIDVKDTLKKKIDADFKKYIILGACNPTLAHKALSVEEELGLLLPCNVIVYEKEKGTSVSLFDPAVMSEIIGNKKLEGIAGEVRNKLERVFNAI
jgi:uncharacterized protein (DUF302 family)